MVMKSNINSGSINGQINAQKFIDILSQQSYTCNNAHRQLTIIVTNQKAVDFHSF